VEAKTKAEAKAKAEAEKSAERERAEAEAAKTTLRMKRVLDQRFGPLQVGTAGTSQARGTSSRKQPRGESVGVSAKRPAAEQGTTAAEQDTSPRKMPKQAQSTREMEVLDALNAPAPPRAEVAQTKFRCPRKPKQPAEPPPQPPPPIPPPPPPLPISQYLDLPRDIRNEAPDLRNAYGRIGFLPKGDPLARDLAQCKYRVSAFLHTVEEHTAKWRTLPWWFGQHAKHIRHQLRKDRAWIIRCFPTHPLQPTQLNA